MKRSKGEKGKGRDDTPDFSPAPFLPLPLSKAFFSDDGSTAMEVALKLAYEFARRTGRSRKAKVLSLHGAYHGDTVGAVSLGHIELFHQAWPDCSSSPTP